MTEPNEEPNAQDQSLDQVQHYYESVAETLHDAFSKDEFSVYDVQKAFGTPHEEAKSIIETMHASGMIFKLPKKNKYVISASHFKTLQEVMDHVSMMKSIHSTNIMFCDMNMSFILSAVEIAKQELKEESKKQDHGQEETSKES